jgi:4-hydroxybenzoate polyprenyltransferase
VKIQDIFGLLRLHVYMPLCFLVALISMPTIEGEESICDLILIGLTNSLVLCSAFVFNDAEDAPDDSLAENPRNPVAQGRISKPMAYTIAAISGLIGVVLAISSSFLTGFLAFSILAITFVYSWRHTRLKASLFWDVLSHMIVSALIFLLACSFHQREAILIPTWIMVFGFSAGAAVAILTHQLYEYGDDLRAGIVTTTVAIGKRRACFLLVFFVFVLSLTVVFEVISGYLPQMPLLVFIFAVVSLLFTSIVLFPKKAGRVSKQVFPWAVSVGTTIAILMWYIS